MRKLNTRGNNQGQGINLNEAYNKLKALYAERSRLEADQKRLWAHIDRHRCDKASEMSAINRKIGATTHKINVLLNQLCQCKKAHKVMNFAYNYISSELERLNKIANKWKGIIRDVDGGRQVLMNSRGQIHTNTSDSKDYLNQKRHQIAQLRKWQAHVAHYRV